MSSDTIENEFLKTFASLSTEQQNSVVIYVKRLIKKVRATLNKHGSHLRVVLTIKRLRKSAQRWKRVVKTQTKIGGSDGLLYTNIAIGRYG